MGGEKVKILAIGDVVSSQGCDYLRDNLPKLKREYQADFVIVNGENSAVGNGVTPLKGLFHLLAPLLVLGLLLHALLVIQSHAGVVLVAQLVLQLSDFLAEEVFALLLVYLFLCAALYLLAQTCQLHQAVQVCQSLFCPLGLAGGRQHLVLHVVTYGQVAAYHVEHER